MKILVSFNGFGLFLKKERRRKSFEYLGEFSKISRLDFYGYLGLIVILKEEFEEVGFMKIVADLKAFDFILGLA